ncbi:hypothetical protein BDF19DRAFT_384649, partial [Syncephalis fuscata]
LKSSIRSIGWKQEYLTRLECLVINTIVTHTYAFARYIFIKELGLNKDFDIKTYISQRFFKQVFLSLVDYSTCKGGLSDETIRVRELIERRLNEYLEYASYTRIDLKYASKIAEYKAQKIATAYLNNVQEHFNQQF